jgi:hypothetical protein
MPSSSSNVVYKAVSFVESGKDIAGYYFYNAPHDATYGKIFAVQGLTLPKAISIMKSLGKDSSVNVKVTIKAYYL